MRRPELLSAVEQFRQFRGPIIVLVLILTFGVAGYMLIEGWPFLDALFMTVTTVTTVGYREVRPLDAAGKVFTMIVILVGVGGAFYTLTALFGWIVSIDWPGERRRRQMKDALSRLENHFIVCGYGRVGRNVAKVLRSEHRQIVVIDVNQASLADAEADGYLTVHGNAASDDVLARAGIDRARGLIAAVDSDADNVYVVLSARWLRPDLLIVARASSDGAVNKLERAGATHALSPYATAGQHMAMLAMRPTAVEFVEPVLRADHQQLIVEQVEVEPNSRLAGTSLGALRALPGMASVIIELRHDGSLVPSPPDEYCLQAGDEIVLIGTAEQLRQVEKLS